LSDIKKIVVIGASAAGLRAASRARRMLPSASITVIDESQYISYGACGMPYVVSGDIGGIKALQETPYGVVRDPDFFRGTKGVEVITQTEVVRINREAQKVYCRSLESGEDSEYSYDKLVLATGASPIMLPGLPQGSDRITTFKTLPDTVKIKQSLAKGEIEKVGIVGAGAIGCEMAEAFAAMWECEVVLIDAAPNVLPNILDVEMGRAVEQYARSEGIEIYTDCPLDGIEETAEGLIIKTPKGGFDVDYVIISVGVRPNTALAVDCGIKLGEAGAIAVDENLLTNDPNIYAAGDCAEVKHLISGKAMNLPLGSLANRQGRAVGGNLAGGSERFGGVVGSAAVKLFDMNVAGTGLTEVAARAAGFDVQCVWGTFADKADYYPEAENLHLKMIFEKTSERLLGLQGYGKGEVVKRVDVFAALLKHEGRVEDLLDAEFAYAPPYASALDPLYSIGAIAKAVMNEGLQTIAPNSPLGDYIILDVRQDKEVKNKPLKHEGVVHVQLGDLRQNFNQVPNGKRIVCMCPKGLRAAEASRILLANGFSDVVFVGGGITMKT